MTMPSDLVTTAVSSIAEKAQPFADAYAASAPLQVGTTYLHLAGLVIGGGIALACDRSIWRTPLQDGAPGRDRLLDELDAVHGTVLIALGVVFITGAMLLLSDVEIFLLASTFWIKMGLVVALLANGAWLRLVIKRLRRESLAQGPGRHRWMSLRISSALSITLWLATTLAGVILTTT